MLDQTTTAATVEQAERTFHQHPHAMTAWRLIYVRQCLDAAAEFAAHEFFRETGDGMAEPQNQGIAVNRCLSDQRFVQYSQLRALLDLIESHPDFLVIEEAVALWGEVLAARIRKADADRELSIAIEAARLAEQEALNRAAMAASNDPAVQAARERVVALGGTITGISSDISMPSETVQGMAAMDFDGRAVADPADLALTAEPAAQVEKPGVARVKKSPFAP